MRSLINAAKIAYKAHKGQKDRAGKSYIFHPLRVSMFSNGYKAKVVALLHDVVEDSSVEISDLKSKFDDDIVEAVDCITKKNDISYEEYLKIVKANTLAREVKINDIRHNINLKRLRSITQNDIERHNKYIRALKFLETGQ